MKFKFFAAAASAGAIVGSAFNACNGGMGARIWEENWITEALTIGCIGGIFVAAVSGVMKSALAKSLTNRFIH